MTAGRDVPMLYDEMGGVRHFHWTDSEEGDRKANQERALWTWFWGMARDDGQRLPEGE